MLDLEIMGRIAATTKGLEKLYHLQQLRDFCPGSGRFLRWACDPMAVFGIVPVEEDCVGSFLNEIPPDQRNRDEGMFWDQVDLICRLLSTKELAPNSHVAWDAFVNLCRLAPSVEHVRWLCRIVCKDLRAGINVSTINKVYPDLITEFLVPLAEQVDPDLEFLPGRWAFEPKLDGQRLVVLDGVCYTRNGRIYTTTEHIRQLTERYCGDWVLDGELMGEGEFNKAAGKMRRKGRLNLESYYNVFDLIPRSEWVVRKFEMTYLERKHALTILIDPSDSVRIVDQEPPIMVDPTWDDIRARRTAMEGRGYEGVMVKDVDSPVVLDRSDRNQKCKSMYPFDAPIVDVTEHRKRKGTLGAVIVRINGVDTAVGSGWTKKEREELYAIRGELAGWYLEGEYQEMTPDGRMRFPVKRKIRKDKG